MAVKARGGSFEAAFSFDGQRYRRSWPTHHEAVIWEADTKAKLTRGESLDGPASGKTVTTLKQLREATMERWWRGSKGEVTADVNSRDCVLFLGEDTPIKSITLATLDGLVSQFKRQQLSGATINRKLAAIGKMLSHAFDRGLIPAKLKLPKQ